MDKEPIKFYRSSKDRIFAGVCGGIAEHFNWDVNIVRVVMVIGSLVFQGLIAVYIVMWLFVPRNPDKENAKKTAVTDLFDSIEEGAADLFKKK